MNYYEQELALLMGDGTTKVQFVSDNHRTKWLNINDDSRQAIKEALFSTDNDTITNDIARLCSIICNSSPDTTIKGEIESLALSIGHHPAIIGKL